jgi:hypothetical protein
MSLLDDAEPKPRRARSPLLTAAEVVELLEHRITTRTLANWRSAGGDGPRYKKIGARIYYPLDAVEEWIEGREFSSTRDYPKWREAQTPKEAEAAEPPLNAIEAVIAEFDVHVAAIRDLLVSRLAEVAVAPAQDKRPRGRPRGSRDKAPRRMAPPRSKK